MNVRRVRGFGGEIVDGKSVRECGVWYQRGREHHEDAVSVAVR